jgi:hypothetical protein
MHGIEGQLQEPRLLAILIDKRNGLFRKDIGRIVDRTCGLIASKNTFGLKVTVSTT